jgi:hypothetical protein
MRSLLFQALLLLSLALSPSLAAAQDATEDGTYGAFVTTPSGRYSVQVEVEGGAVTGVYWPNGGRMTVMGGELEGGEAFGSNRRGDQIQIEIDDLSYNSDPRN